MKTNTDGFYAEQNSSYAVKILNAPRSIRKTKINISFASHIKINFSLSLIQQLIQQMKKSKSDL